MKNIVNFLKHILTNDVHCVIFENKRLRNYKQMIIDDRSALTRLIDASPLKRREIAKKAMISTNYLWKLEHGKVPRLDLANTLRAILRAESLEDIFPDAFSIELPKEEPSSSGAVPSLPNHPMPVAA